MRHFPATAAVAVLPTIDLCVRHLQIFAGTVFLLLLLGAMVIYALVLGDVEAKTYEYGFASCRLCSFFTTPHVTVCLFCFPTPSAGTECCACSDCGTARWPSC